MADEEKKVERTPIDISGIVMLEGVQPPSLFRDSKYPWHEIFGREGAAFFIPFDDEDSAKTARVSIQASGQNFCDKRKFNAKAVSRLYKHKGQLGVASWLIMLFDGDEVDEHEDEDVVIEGEGEDIQQPSTEDVANATA